MPKVEGKAFGYGASGRRASSRAAEDLSEYVNSPGQMTTDRGAALDQQVATRAAHTKDGKRYAPGAAHQPFAAIKQPGMGKSSKRHSI